jgi:hypothetical protein
MGNIISNISLDEDNLKIQELSSDNIALKKQVEYLKEIIKKDGQTIEDLNEELKCRKVCEKCFLCDYLKK